MNLPQLVRQKIFEKHRVEQSARQVPGAPHVMSHGAYLLTICFSPAGFRQFDLELEATDRIMLKHLNPKPRTFDGIPIYIDNKQSSKFRVVER